MAKISIILVILAVVGLIGAVPRPQDDCDLFCFVNKQMNNNHVSIIEHGIPDPFSKTGAVPRPQDDCDLLCFMNKRMNNNHVSISGAVPRPQDNCDLFCSMKKQINNGLPGNTLVKKSYHKEENGNQSYTSDNFGSKELDGLDGSSFTLAESFKKHEDRDSSVIINNGK